MCKLWRFIIHNHNAHEPNFSEQWIVAEMSTRKIRSPLITNSFRVFQINKSSSCGVYNVYKLNLKSSMLC